MYNVAEHNRRKYLQPPDWKRIEKTVKKCQVSLRRFEKFFGIPENTLKQVKSGKRKMPAAYWHLFNEERTILYLKAFQDALGTNLGTLSADDILASMPPEKQKELISLIIKKGAGLLLTEEPQTNSLPDNPMTKEQTILSDDVLSKFRKKK